MRMTCAILNSTRKREHTESNKNKVDRFLFGPSKNDVTKRLVGTLSQRILKSFRNPLNVTSFMNAPCNHMKMKHFQIQTMYRESITKQKEV
jgi:hypothetical protein